MIVEIKKRSLLKHALYPTNSDTVLLKFDKSYSGFPGFQPKVFGAFTNVLLKFEFSVDFSILARSQQRGHAASAKWGSLLSF
jgi:hypothetical protein